MPEGIRKLSVCSMMCCVKQETFRTIWYSKYGIKNVINWCSNDYPGMGQHKIVIDAMKTALDTTEQAVAEHETYPELHN